MNLRGCFLLMMSVLSFGGCGRTAQDSRTEWPTEIASAHATDPRRLLAIENLHAWCVVPFDAKGRGPVERAQMLQALGFKRFAYDWRAKDVPDFEAEIEAARQHGIEIIAWWSPTDPKDPVLPVMLETFKRQSIRPQLWVMGGGPRTWTPGGQSKRIEAEAQRIRSIVELAKPYGCKVGLYNHNGWFGDPDNEVAVIERLKSLGIQEVGMIYNFSHAHRDLAEFPSIWKRIKPYVEAVNVTGMVPDGDSRIIPPSQGSYELPMLRVIVDSGWRGPVGVIAEQGGDAAITLHDNLQGLEWLKRELVRPGSGGSRPAF